MTAWRLACSHLAKRGAADKLIQTVVDMCGAHAQLASSVPLAIGARVRGLSRDDVEAAIARDRSLVKTWAMRGTLHVFAADDVPLYCAGQRTRQQYMNAPFLRAVGLELADVEAVLDAIPRALDGRTLTREELADAIVRITKRPHLADRLRSGWGELLKPAAFRGLLCFGPQDGRSATFVRPDQWIGRWRDLDTDDALREAFRRFLSAYAPASRAEVARWWGVRPPEAGRVLKQMAGELAEVRIAGVERWALATDLRAMKASPEVKGVRLLPSFDQLLVMSAPHSDAVVDEAFARRVYRPRIAVWSLPAVLIDGRIGAAWRIERKPDRAVVTVEPFGRIARPVRTALAEEIEGLAPLLGSETRLEVAG